MTTRKRSPSSIRLTSSTRAGHVLPTWRSGYGFAFNVHFRGIDGLLFRTWPVPIGGEAKPQASSYKPQAPGYKPRNQCPEACGLQLVACSSRGRGGGRWAERRPRQKTGEDCGLGVFSPSALPPSRLDTCESGRNRHDETAAVAGTFSLPRRRLGRPVCGWLPGFQGGEGDSARSGISSGFDLSAPGSPPKQVSFSRMSLISPSWADRRGSGAG